MTIDGEKVKKHAFTLFATALLSVILICSFVIATWFLGDSSKAHLLLMTMTIAGAAGGIVNYFYSNMRTNMVAPKDLIPCVIVGIGASLLLPFLFSLTSSTLLQTASETASVDPKAAAATVVNYLTIISWSLLAGISGEPLISLMTTRFISTIGEDKVEAASLTITSRALADGTVGAEYSQTLEAKNGKGQLTWDVIPPLPNGLKLYKATGKISGIPTDVLKETELTFVVRDCRTPNPQSAAITLSLKINADKVPGLKISTTSLPDGAVGKSYKETLKAEHGNGQLTWGVRPALPKGLDLDPTDGIISGTPIEIFEEPLNVTVRDSSKPDPQLHNQKIKLTITA